MKNFKSLIIVAIALVLCSFSFSNVKASSPCPSASFSCDEITETQARIRVLACLNPGRCNQPNDEYRFYYKHGEDSWQHILLTEMIPNDCDSPCKLYTCSIVLPCDVDYQWEIRCNDSNPPILSWLSEGYDTINCPCSQ
jgi:hypothetical protein